MQTSGMSLYRRGETWWSRILIDGAVHQFSTKTSNKNIARSVEAAKRNELAKGRAGLAAPTLEEFTNRFWHSMPGRISQQTRKFYHAHWMPLIDFKPLGECRIDRIDSALIQEFINYRMQTVGIVTVNHNLRTLRRALHRAVEWNLILKVPKIELLKNEPQRDYVISEEDVLRFGGIKELKGPPAELAGLADGSNWMGKLVPFLVDTGLRRRECVFLEWRDVNMAERYIEIKKGKTRFARRKIPMTNRVQSILAGMPRDHERVWTVKGRPITVDRISHAFLDAPGAWIAGRLRSALYAAYLLHTPWGTWCRCLRDSAFGRPFQHQHLATLRPSKRGTARRCDWIVRLGDGFGNVLLDCILCSSAGVVL